MMGLNINEELDCLRKKFSSSTWARLSLIARDNKKIVYVDKNINFLFLSLNKFK
jgi:hypothetical protein